MGVREGFRASVDVLEVMDHVCMVGGEADTAFDSGFDTGAATSLGGDSTMGVMSSSLISCLTIAASEGRTLESSEPVVDDAASTSIFRRLPLGAGSSGVRQYVTVRVTTWRTLTLPGLPAASTSTSRGEKEALHGAAERGVEE